MIFHSGRLKKYLIVTSLLLLTFSCAVAWSAHSSRTFKEPLAETIPQPTIVPYVGPPLGSDLLSGSYGVYVRKDRDQVQLQIIWDETSNGDTIRQRKVVAPDNENQIVEVEGISPTDTNWLTLINDKFAVRSDIRSNLPYILGLVESPKGDLIFSIAVERMLEDRPSETEVSIYILPAFEQSLNQLSKIATFDTEIDDFSFPHIGQFSDDGRYLELKLYSCWGCEPPFPETLLVDLATYQTRNVGKIYFLHWWDNGQYSYRLHETELCADQELPPELTEGLSPGAICSRADIGERPIQQGRF